MRRVDCRPFRGQLIELARGAAPDAALEAHLESCPDCAREFEEQQALTAALRNLAAAHVPPPALLESKLLAEFDTAAHARRRRNMLRWMPLAAALFLAAFVWGRLWLRPPALQVHSPAPPTAPTLEASVPPAPPALPTPRIAVRKRTPRPAAAAAASRQESQSAETFVAIPYTEPLAPGERTEVLRMDVPVAAIVAAGLPLEVADAGARARADVLVGEDGRARAIRLISISTLQ